MPWLSLSCYNDCREQEVPPVNSERYERYDGQETEVILSTGSGGRPLAVIASKAFLSCKSIERLVLPDSLEAVEDWGFAHMKNLREIVFPAKDIRFGRQIFLGCERLERVRLRDMEPEIQSGLPGIPELLASMFRFFPQERLEDIALAGDRRGQWKWLAAYDDALEDFLKRPDDTGFEPAFIGWFDVEDVDDQRADYILQHRKNKIRLVFQRLLYGTALQEELRIFLQSILTRHTYLVQELFSEDGEHYGRDIRYYKIWHEAGGLNRKIAGRLLDRLPEEEPEIRAYLMKVQMEQSGDFFAELEL